MQALCPRPHEHVAVRTDLKAIFVSLELSRSTWIITSLAPGGGEKMSKHSVPSGDIAALLARLAQLQEKACARTGRVFPIIVHPGSRAGRVLDPPGPAKRRDREPCRRSRLDRDVTAASAGGDGRVDGEALVCTPLAHKRGGAPGFGVG